VATALCGVNPFCIESGGFGPFGDSIANEISYAPTDGTIYVNCSGPSFFDYSCFSQGNSYSDADATNNGTPPTSAFSGALSIPLLRGVLIVVPVAITSKEVCLGLGGGFGSPGFGVDAGIIHTASSNIVDVLEGASVSVGAASGWLGVQWSHNASGIAAGNLMGTPGVSVTVSYSVCF